MWRTEIYWIQEFLASPSFELGLLKTEKAMEYRTWGLPK